MRMTAPLEVAIVVEKIERVLPFYTDSLGLGLVEVIEVAGEKAKQLSLTQGSYRLARLQTPAGERVRLVQPSVAPKAPAPFFNTLDVRTTSFLAFFVADLDQILARLRQDPGATLLSGLRPVTVRPGLQTVFVKDPEGNVVELSQDDNIEDYRPDLYAPE